MPDTLRPVVPEILPGPGAPRPTPPSPQTASPPEPITAKGEFVVTPPPSEEPPSPADPPKE